MPGEVGIQMRQKSIQAVGIVVTFSYAAFIIWIYATEPRSFKEVATSAEIAAGTYQINQGDVQSCSRAFPT